ncbi:Y-family DNA polymerase [soil metagenome]
MSTATPSPRLFALVDASNFYVSCQRVFEPRHRAVPVAVLSSNDGCVIARSEEVKAMGVPMGVPYFKVRDQMTAAGTVVYSANFELYQDMSRRVMETLGTFTPDVEVYSIDEAFLRLDPASPRALTYLAARIHQRVLRWTGIAMRVSIASTRTLAKAGSEHARSLQKRGEAPAVFLHDADQITALLDGVPAESVWGIGRAHAAKLSAQGIRTARQLRDRPDEWIRQHLHTPGLRTVFELRGIPCSPESQLPHHRKSLLRSRSFGRSVTEQQELREAVAGHMASAAMRLRAEGLVARHVSVYLFAREGRGAARLRLVAGERQSSPTNQTPELLKAAMRCLERAFRPGERYGKAGVGLSEISPAGAAQSDLFAPDNARTPAMLTALDERNARFGKGTIAFGSEGNIWGRARSRAERRDRESGHDWAAHCALRSPAFTTQWTDLAPVRS